MVLETDLKINPDSLPDDSSFGSFIKEIEQEIKEDLAIEKHEDILLYGILSILENKGLGGKSPSHLIQYKGNSVSISFFYGDTDTAQNNHRALIEFLGKEKNIDTIDSGKKENGFTNIKTKSGKDLTVYYKEGKDFIYIDGTFTNNAINLGKKKCSRLKNFINTSISKQEEQKKIDKEKAHKKMREDDSR